MSLETIPYVDHPEIKINEHESTEMPFRYVADRMGKPIMPAVRMLKDLGRVTRHQAKYFVGHDISDQEGH